jgi:hypothetical protein
MIVALSGYIVERVLFDRISRFSDNDFQQLAFYALEMYRISNGKDNSLLETEIIDIVNASVTRTTAFIEENADKVKLLGDELIIRKTLSRKDIQRLIGDCGSQSERPMGFWARFRDFIDGNNAA